ncbi:hypothetical protein K440DRAFT_635960 [Wilcoxina mikolae CBS 423.85]|nr:hypothetical protein K440DRAFT_635960 [Wilcoxina mikolae CBS 423.85]
MSILSLFITTPLISRTLVQRFIPTTVLSRRDEAIDGIGLGKRPGCADHTNKILNNTSELDKASSVAGVTLMTLLPALLTFAPLPTVNIRDSMYTSIWLSLLAAGMTFGLPGTQCSSVSDERINPTDKDSPNQGQTPHDRSSAEHAELSQVTNNTPSDPEMSPSASTRDNDRNIIITSPGRRKLVITKPKYKRSLLWFATCITSFGILQWSFVMILVLALPLSNRFTVIWACNSSAPLYLGWLCITYELSSAVLLHWNSTFMSPQMVLHCYFPPEDYNTSERQPPEGLPKGLRHKKFSTWEILGQYSGVLRISPVPRLRWLRAFLKSNRTKETPIIVRYVEGAAQAIMLLLLTLLFGSLWGQQLFHSFYFVLAFTFTVFISRALQLATNLTIFQCQNLDDMAEVELDLMSIPNVLISNKTSGHSYLNKKRVFIDDSTHQTISACSKGIAKCYILVIYGISGFPMYFSLRINTWNLFYSTVLFSYAYLIVAGPACLEKYLKDKATYSLVERDRCDTETAGERTGSDADCEANAEETLQSGRDLEEAVTIMVNNSSESPAGHTEQANSN